jgi:O-antigen/teichoic acid export membrane protein
MTYLRRLFKQNSFVTVAHLLISVSGLVTFPFWTRIFTESEYGIMSLGVTTIFFVGSLSKFGLQHAATRFYPEFTMNKRGEPISFFYTTMFASTAVFGLAMCAVFAVVVSLKLVPLADMPLNVILLTAVLSFTGGFRGLLNVVLLAEQRSRLWSIVSVIERYGQMFLSIALVAYLIGGLAGYFIGQLVVEVAVLCFLLAPYFLDGRVRPGHYSKAFLMESLWYGFPLLGFELSRTVLSLGDRYLINHFMGASALGVYSVGYNLCTYIVGIIATPVRMTVMPMYLEIWEKDGREKTAEFLGKVLSYYLMILMPVFFGLNYLRKDILLFLASTKYEVAGVVIPYVSAALIMNGAYFILGAGLYINKNSRKLFKIVVVSTVFNIALDLVLIPYYGLEGAAAATLLAYLFFVAALAVGSRNILSIKIEYLSAVKYAAASAVMLAALALPGVSHLHVAGRIAAGVVVYFVVLYIIDGHVRQLFHEKILGR